MSISSPSIAYDETVVANLPSSVRQIICTTPGLNTRDESSPVFLRGVVALTMGTGSTSATVSIYRGVDTSGHLVAQSTLLTAAAGAVVAFPIEGVDFPGAVAGQSYCLVVGANGATAPTTIQYATLSAMY